MRRTKGRLICVWTPASSGVGVSTIALATAVTMQHLTNRRTLVINMGSKSNYMEQYLKNDAEARFSMDYLKSFDEGITADHILTYSSAVNEQLYILPNCKIDRAVNKVGKEFDNRLLDRALEVFDFVIVDIEGGYFIEREMFLDKADVILAVLNKNPIMLKDIMENDEVLCSHLKADKTIPIFNQLQPSENAVKSLNALNLLLDINNSFGIVHDANLNRAACYDGKLYSFLKKELNRKKVDNLAIVQFKELCGIMSQKLMIQMDGIVENISFVGMLFSKVRLRGEVDV